VGIVDLIGGVSSSHEWAGSTLSGATHTLLSLYYKL